jgi:5'-nucleotidase
MHSAPLATTLILTFSLLVIAGTAGAQNPRLTILHTNDMHSHFLGTPNADYDPTVTGDGTTGGIARIATLVNQIRSERDLESIPVLLLDGGDFAMGTLFHLLEGEAEMGIMNHLGYDHITLGNHEFDWLPEGAAGIVGFAAGLPVEATNTEVTDPSDPGGQAVQDLIDAGAILPYKVDTLFNGITYGVFGILGDGAANVVFRPFGAEAYPLEFTDRFAAAANTVDHLKNTEGVDIVICLSHSGVDEPNVWEGEDPDLAAAVPGIDVIISGHTHTDLATPVMVGSTIIVQAKAYTKRLGELNLELAPGGLSMLSYVSHTIDDTLLGDPATQALVQGYKNDIDTNILGPMGYSFDGQIAETDFDLDKAYKVEHNLGNLVADSIRWSVDQIINDPSDPVDVAVESNGVTRDGIQAGATGRINTSDAFRAVPLGVDPVNGAAGYPLVSFCLNGEEIYNAGWVNALAAYLNDSDYWLSWSGVRFQYTDYLPPLSMWQCLDADDPTCAVNVPISKSSYPLYRIAVNYYVATNIESVADLSFGLIVLEPKDCETGEPLASLADAIVYEAAGDPLTQWEGFLDFLAQLPDTDSDGIPNIPARYAGPEGRMVKACVIATVSYGSPFDEKVGLLREFRDEILLKSAAGKKFVDLYYEHGGFLAEAVAEHEWVRALIRVLLLPLVGVAKLLLLFV